MAYGLPVEGDDGPFLGSFAHGVASCPATGTVADARRVLEGGPRDSVVVVADGLVVGELRAGDLDGRRGDQAVLEVLRPVPSTVRPSVTVASVAEAGGGRRMVTTSDGRLVGEAVVEADDHQGHDHASHGDLEGFEAELTAVMDAVGEHFGDKQPTEDELRAFLRELLVAEGRTPDDADRFMAAMGGDKAG
ncbi:MAG: hypothetical protein ACR2HY_10530 [Acidimicrobiales bacterium]